MARHTKTANASLVQLDAASVSASSVLCFVHVMLVERQVVCGVSIESILLLVLFALLVVVCGVFVCVRFCSFFCTSREIMLSERQRTCRGRGQDDGRRRVACQQQDQAQSSNLPLLAVYQT